MLQRIDQRIYRNTFYLYFLIKNAIFNSGMKHFFSFALLVFLSMTGFGQTYNPVQWDSLKQAGQLNRVRASVTDSGAVVIGPMDYQIAPNTPVQPASNICQCWQTRDANWNPIPCTNGTAPEYRNDDGSTAIINLPFNFCLYGQTWNQVYINNNGNISFGAPYGTFTATGFPNAAFTMVAPFWSDVDTRNTLSGLPWYIITPTHLIVQWDSVGYYANHVDKLNSFQVIITDGTDPIVPGGNVSFCYQDMQWTTGDASSGVNGFNGSDAIVGANLGDGVNYIQFGAFNQPGGTYNGPLAANSGIDWLDYQTFIFDACTNSNNIPPTVAGISVCDTLTLCEGDTLPLNITFFSPEGGQITTVTIDTTGTTGYFQVANTPGNSVSLGAYFVGSPANSGYNNITIIATDNGTPAGVTTIPIVVQVLAAPFVTASNDTTICSGSPVNLNSSGAVTYTWSPSAGLSNTTISNPVATPTITTTYVVTGSNGTCDASETVVITVQTPAANAGNDVTICEGDAILLNASGGTAYSWAPATGLSNTNIATPVASPTVTTTYTVTVTDGLGCVATDVITVTVNPTPSAAFSVTPTSNFIDSAFIFLDASVGGTQWIWLFGDGDTSFTQNTTHFYTTSGMYNVCLIVVGGNGCTDTACSTVEVLPQEIEVPNVFTPNGDGTNDLLVFKNLEFFPNTSLYVYDRWGALVYESANYMNDWNGKMKGTGGDCTDGTYYFVLNGPGLKAPVTGFVSLIRGK